MKLHTEDHKLFKMIGERMILNISVETLDGVSRIEPEGGWKNKSLQYHIRVSCRVCNIELFDLYNGTMVPLYLSAASWKPGLDGIAYHRPLTCPVCKGYGGLRILKRGGKPVVDEGEGMPVMEVQVVGKFRVHKDIKLFYFGWMCRKDDDDDDDDSSGVLGPFYVDKKGNYAFKYMVKVDDEDDEVILQIKGLKGSLELTEWEEQVDGLRIKCMSGLDSDTDSDD
uniref:uncharacterized protein LOC105350360 n=1 Tax=Fragaria vesca subsp. vesca TaxID=101020 RepID=UPI0005C966CC|nr:PREDICTED: uncharacterized protein LOC105350360 [Fragaria vesca subsp. vesca]